MSKTEKELLELAAKAAGIKGDWCAFFGITGHGAGKKQFGIGDPAVFTWGTDRLWNPLEDDGDALRLAVDLEIDVSIQPHMQRAVAMTNRNGYSVVGFGDDRYSAVRRAIVLAAAEIGKGMP